MPRSLIVYFSQGGTTARVADSIAAGLRRAQFEVDLCNMRGGQPSDPSGYDLLGVGAPAYYYQPPFNVMDYVADLPDLAGLPAFVFVLHGTYQGDTGNILRQALARKGAREAGYFHCHGADYALGYLREGYLFSPDHPGSEDLAEAEGFGLEVASDLNGRVYAKPNPDPPPALVYRMQRCLVNRWLARTFYSRQFRVDAKRCTACGGCMDGCPTSNITPDGEGKPVWGRECLLCLYCEMNCPEDAIRSPSSWPVVRPFFRYNVHRAAQDPALEHAPVKHGKGRTVRL
jgi:flavodoxin/ferredoxin